MAYNSAYPYNLPNNPPTNTTTLNNSGYTVVGQAILNGDVSFYGIQVINNGTGSITHFKVQIQLQINGPWFDYLGDSDFQSTTEATMVKSSTLGVNQTTSGAESFAIIRVDSAFAIQLLAQASDNTTSVTVSSFFKRIRLNI